MDIFPIAVFSNSYQFPPTSAFGFRSSAGASLISDPGNPSAHTSEHDGRETPVCKDPSGARGNRGKEVSAEMCQTTKMRGLVRAGRRGSMRKGRISTLILM